jgi:hypothetical protein
MKEESTLARREKTGDITFPDQKIVNINLEREMERPTSTTR